MTRDEIEAIRARYATEPTSDAQELGFAVVSRDINQLLDALPESPRNTLLRKKWLDAKADHPVAFWLAQQDVQMLCAEIQPIEKTDEQVPPIVLNTDVKLPTETGSDVTLPVTPVL